MTGQSDSHDPMRFHVVTGMHRSHTSLLGRMLVDAGMAFHDRLVPPGSANPYGHYEDVDLLRLQRAILADNGAKWYSRVDRRCTISPQRRREAEQIIGRRFDELGNDWGFKVPDSSLFLDFWAEWPAARFLLIFREPAEVLSSLYRRMGAQLYLRPDAVAAMARSYVVYNERILAHRLAHPDRTFLLASAHLVARPGSVLRAAAEKLRLPLDPAWNGERLIDRQIVSARSQAVERWISRAIARLPRLQRVHAQLQDAADSTAVFREPPAAKGR